MLLISKSLQSSLIREHRAKSRWTFCFGERVGRVFYLFKPRARKRSGLKIFHQSVIARILV
jgi:hypothetical protein